MMDANFVRNYLNQTLGTKITNITEVKMGKQNHLVWSEECHYPEIKLKIDTGKEILDVYIIREIKDNNEIHLLTYIPEGAIA